jgi:hypothetical protein
MFSLCLDWNYVGSGGGSLGALFTPLTTQVSQYIGECLIDHLHEWTASLTPFPTGVALCIMIFCGMYATNAWNSAQFPFLSQQLFFANGRSISTCPCAPGGADRSVPAGSIYDQTLILTPDFQLNKTALDIFGLPQYAGSNAIYYLGCNLAIGATLTHVGL